VDRRIAENQTGKRMAVMTLRQRDGRTVSAAVPGERGDVAWQLVKNHVEKGAELRTDENSAYDELAGLNAIVRNNHSVAFVVEPDASTNQVESHFSRLRRAEIGIHHHIAGKYLDWYAADVAWREDYRCVDFRVQSKTVLGSALGKPVSRNMAGYWQRSGKAKEALVGWTPMNGMTRAAQ
jgi:hypothetical protein